MLPETPFLQLVPGRVAELLRRLQRAVWTDPTPVEVWHAEPTEAHLTFAEGSSRPLTRCDGPFYWGRLWDTCWFRLVLPEAADSSPRYLHWREQGESTCYVDGVPYYGFDGPHQHCALPPGTREVWIESMCYGTGVDATRDGCRFAGATLLRRDDAAWQAWNDVQLLFELLAEEHRDLFPPGSIYGGAFGWIPPVANVSVLYRRMLRQLDEAISAYDNGGLAALQPALEQIFAQFPADSLALDCVLTGHAHIDLVWLWPEKAGAFKCVHTMSSMTRLMALYPEFRFNFTQPAGYQSVEARAPELIERVQGLMQTGQWEATGASYVECDTQLACGEALARGVVIGQQHYQRLRGERASVLWLPDVFGYSASVPQILRQCGVESFFTTKLTWCSVNRFPYSSFLWQGHDGSEVLAHVTQDVGYNGQTAPRELKAGELAYRQSDVHNAFLAPTGHGDGGGGVTESMCERARRLANLASMPKVRWGRIEDFFADLNKVRDRLPAWRGELYLEYHRGVQTTHSHAKAAFRGLERALQYHEAASCVTDCAPIDQRPWERLVFSQFHDWLPGSSIHEVYDEGEAELNTLAEQAIAASGAKLAAPGLVALFNPLALPTISNTHAGRFRLPALSGAPIDQLERADAQVPVLVTEHELRNSRLRATFDALGQIESLTVDGQPVAIASPLGALAVYPDHPHNYAAWDIDRSTLANGEVLTSRASVKVEESLPEMATLAFTRWVSGRSSIVVRYRLEADSPVLRIDYTVDWRDEHTLLKTLFPTAYAGVNARFGQPFGSVLRGQQPGRERDEAQWEVAASRWAAVSDDTELDGLMVITENKYGFTCRDGNLMLSLVRSAAITNEGLHQPVRRTAAEHPTSDIGVHTIRLAIGRYHADAPREELPAALADLLFTPPMVYAGEPVQTAFLGLDGGDTLVPAWAQPAGDGAWVLRLSETLGRRGVARLKLADGYRAEAVDLLGQPTGQDVSDGIAFGPYALISVRIGRA